MTEAFSHRGLRDGRRRAQRRRRSGADRDKITLSIATLVALALLNAGLAWRSAELSQTYLESVMLADSNLALYLDVAANMNDLAKQYADALIIGDRDGGEGERVLKERLAEDLARCATRRAARSPCAAWRRSRRSSGS